ncbi:Hypothetical predicted protein [Pelobates cultripes]|uniref:Reverse transcriptase zinc-binding domain-containing protein n=1 Tax=Pelobates cultripes TaxID=61616 RepID=A0AAD1VV44_PELCU|nr:Hypothetical predicted protein [Pelobates cultripes]
MTCRQHWEAEGETELTDEDWLSALNGLKRWTKCYSHVEAHRKLLYRWYMTPNRLHKMYPVVPAECRRCAAETGTLPHVWWHCSGIQPLWRDVKDILDALGIRDFPMNIESCLLLLFPKETHENQKQLLLLILMAARNLIALYWKKHSCPSAQQLKDKIQQFYKYEKMSTDTIKATAKFRETWEGWEMWYKEGDFLE